MSVVFVSLRVTQADMKEEAIQQLAGEMEDLQEQHRDIISKVSGHDCLYAVSRLLVLLDLRVKDVPVYCSF